VWNNFCKKISICFTLFFPPVHCFHLDFWFHPLICQNWGPVPPVWATLLPIILFNIWHLQKQNQLIKIPAWKYILCNGFCSHVFFMFLFRCYSCFEFWPLWAVTRNGTKLRFWEQFFKTYNPCCIKSENQLWYIALVLKNLRIDSDRQLHFNKKSKNHFNI
jgi:hypothetical protein